MRQRNCLTVCITILAFGTLSILQAQETALRPAGPVVTGDLGAALALGDLQMVRQLVAAGADANSAKGVVAAPAWLSALLMGEKPMFVAMAEVMKIVPTPADSKRQIGADALAAAASKGYADVIQTLLDKGVDVNAREFMGTTALMIAAANGNDDIVQLLLNRKADLNVADRHGDTTLMSAVRAGSLSTVKTLLSAGADPMASDKNGVTAAWWVARTDRVDILKALIAKGANINTPDNSGRTPLTTAARMGQLSMVRELRTNGAVGPVAQHSPRLLIPAVETSIHLIQTGIEAWLEKTRCRSCHHTDQGLQATLVAREYGIKLDQKLADKHLEELREEVSKWGTAAAKAIANPEASAGPNLPLPYQERAYIIATGLELMPGIGNFPEEPFANLSIALGNLQFQDGHWIHGLARVPTESSDALTTAYAIHSLQRFAPSQERQKVDARIAHATEWLKRSMSVTTDDLVGELYGFYWTKTTAELGQAAQKLLRQQKPDGSWAQKPGMNGDAYATGVALFTLHETRQLSTGAAAYQRGVAYLLRTQEDDGSWLVPTRAVPLNGYLESGSPHGKHQFISFAGTCWATMALTLATRGTDPI